MSKKTESKVEVKIQKATVAAGIVFFAALVLGAYGVYSLVKGPQTIKADAVRSIKAPPAFGKRSVLTIQKSDGIDPASIYESSAVMGNGAFKVTRPAYPLTLEGICENKKVCSLTINSRADFPKDDVVCDCDPSLYLLSFVDPIEKMEGHDPKNKIQ